MLAPVLPPCWLQFFPSAGSSSSTMSEIETLTGEDATERVEMALGQPITSREQSPERTLQERKLQNNLIIAP